MNAASTTVYVGIDENQNGSLDLAERKLALNLRVISFAGTIVSAGRTSAPAETGVFEIKEDEHFEVGGTFRFVVSGGVTGEPSLIRYAIMDQDGINDELSGGKGLDFSYTFGSGTDVGDVFVTAYADANDNHEFDWGEISVNSKLFEVKPFRRYDLAIDVSTAIPGGTTATASTIVGNARDILLRKDGPNDWRAIIEFRVVSAATFAPTPARPDPVVYSSSPSPDADAHFNAAADIVFVSDITDPGTVGLCQGNDWHRIIIEWQGTQSDTEEILAHEFGHGVGLGHAGGSPQVMAASGLGGYNQITKPERDKYEEE